MEEQTLVGLTLQYFVFPPTLGLIYFLIHKYDYITYKNLYGFSRFFV